MEEPLPFEMDRLYADLKAAGESKTMNQHEAAKARHAAERLAEGINPPAARGASIHWTSWRRGPNMLDVARWRCGICLTRGCSTSC